MTGWWPSATRSAWAAPSPAGILSARGRHIGEGPYDDFLQIDAPINRGNSGGPLFAQDGTVIGVNTAIYSPSGGSVGIGFAIPSSVVKQVVGQLEANGHVERGWLGVAAQPVSPTMAKALLLPGATGALVAEVQKDSPAAAAGMQPGDVITMIGSQPVKDPRALAQMVAALHSGSDQAMTVRRDGQDKTLTVAVAAQPDQDSSVQQAAAEQGPRLGLALAPLNDEARQELNLAPGQKGRGDRRGEAGQPGPAGGAASRRRPGDGRRPGGHQPATGRGGPARRHAEVGRGGVAGAAGRPPGLRRSERHAQQRGLNGGRALHPHRSAGPGGRPFCVHISRMAGGCLGRRERDRHRPAGAVVTRRPAPQPRLACPAPRALPSPAMTTHWAPTP